MTRVSGIAAAFVVALALAPISARTGANAVTLTSTPLFAGSAQANAVCYFLNAGNATVAKPTITIRDEAGVAQVVVFSSCLSTGVLPGHTCGIGVLILNNQAYNCTIVESSAGAVVTGGLELRDSNSNTLINQHLQHIQGQDEQ
jgi:hypothetical protein